MNNKYYEDKINNGKMSNLIRVIKASDNAPNLIFLYTPIASIKNDIILKFIKGFEGKVNLFLVDFNGLGESEGIAKDISLENFEKTFVALIQYIQSKFKGSINLYGGTGTGGIIAQYLMTISQINKNINKFIQYGVAIHNDTSIMGNSTKFKIMYSLIKFFNLFAPGYRVKFKIPKYSGYNAEKEEAWYKDIQKIKSNAFDFQISLFKLILDIFFMQTEHTQYDFKCPLLIIAPEHDRYYYKDYINRYYSYIKSKKEIHWINGSHISFDWKAEEINTYILKWINE